jgi:adenylate cyclase
MGEPAPDIDFEAEGLLDGLEGEQRAERLALLQQLAADGVPLNELRRNTAAGTVMFLPADRIIVGDERYTAAEIAERTGIEPDMLNALSRAMGLPIAEPDDPVYTDLELNAAERLKIARALGIPDDETLALLRVLGRSLSQAAESLRAMPLKMIIEPGLSEVELAQRYAAAVERMYPLVDPMISSILTLHLRHATQTEVINALERSGGELPGSREIAVAFADLVGFTRLGEEVPPDELGRLAARLEALASEVAEPPVRLVKTIGDAAMLASPDPEPLLGATLGLIEAADAEGEEFPQIRAGAALGAALPRAGDWFGRPVNLASRITAVARPGSLLADQALHESAAQGYSWSFAGNRRLKGLRDPVRLFRARRQPARAAD